MDITCPKCQALYLNIPEKYAKRSVRCKKCNHRFLATEVSSPQETVLAHTSKQAPSPQQTQRASPQLQETQLAVSSKFSDQQNQTPVNNYQQTQSSKLSNIIGLGSEHFSLELSLSEQTVHDWRKGEVLLELYEVKGLLGEGQFGKVFQLRHRDWNIDLAVKTPKQKALHAGSEVIEKEAETWVNLDLHPNIVNCYYVRRINGIPQIFSEYVDGGDLKQLIFSRNIYQGGEQKALLKILDVAIQFAWGLDYAHEQGLIHQDIKPANIMITSDGVVKVTDFGLAKAGALANVPNQNSKQTIVIDGMGMTPAYASPEQVLGRALTRRTDIWSWAVCILEMILGYCSWESGTVAPAILEAYNDHSLDDKPAIATIPEALTLLLEHCFEETEDKRPESLLHVANELLDIYRNESGNDYPRIHPQEGSGTASSLNNQAISLLDLGQKDEAMKAWKHALSIDPQHFETNHNFLMFQWKNQGLDEAELLAKIASFYAKSAEKSQSEKNSSVKYIACALAKLYVQFGYYKNAIKILNYKQEVLEQLPTDLSNEAYKVLGLALCARYRLVKHSDKWLGAVACLKKSVLNNVIDPYSITAYTLALQRSGQKKLAALFFKSSLSMGVIPRQFKQAVALFLPGYEVLYRIAKKHIDVIRFINNGETLLFNQGNTLIVWNLQKKCVTHKMTGHLGQITAFDVSQDETLVISGSGQGDIRVWDIITGRMMNVWTAHKDTINAVKISACGQFLYTASGDNTLCKWDYQNKSQINSFYGEGHSDAINDIQLSFSDTQIVSASSDNSLRLWDNNSGRTIKIIPGHERAITSVCWLDEKHIISGSEDKTIRLWNVATGQCVKIFSGHQGIITCLSLSIDKQFILSGSSDGAIRIWNINTGTSFVIAQFSSAIRSIAQDESGLFALIVTPSGVSLIETNNDFKYRAAYLFSLPESATEIDHLSRKYQRKLKRAKSALNNHYNVTSMQEISQARSLKGYERDLHGFKYWSKLYSIFPKLKLNDVWKFCEINEHKKRISSLDFSPVNNTCYSASKDHSVYQWDVERQQRNKIFSRFESPVSAIKVTANGQGLLIASGNNILVMDIKGGKQLAMFCHHVGDVLAMVITADGRFALSSDDKGSFFLWRLLTGEVIADYSGATGAITSIAVTPDGRFAFTGHRHNHSISIWNMEEGKITSVLEEHDNIVTCLAVTSNGRNFISASADASLRLWQVESSRKKSIQVMRGHTGRVNQVAIDYQNKLAVSVSDDKTIKFWDIVNGKCLHTFENSTSRYTAVAISMNGQYALSGDSRGNINVWCLDWFLQKKSYHEWDLGADVYLKNYISTHKTLEPYKELSKIIKICQYAGYGWLDRNEISIKVLEFYQLNVNTILPGSKLSRTYRSEKNNASRKKIILYAFLAGIFISGFFTFSQKDQPESDQDYLAKEEVILDKEEKMTVDKLRDIAVLLAGVNDTVVVHKGKIIISSLVVFENIKELQTSLRLSRSDLIDSWGHAFNYKGIKAGVFRGRIMLQSAGKDQLFKTKDDLILNGFPHWSSLSIKKNNKTILKLSLIKNTIKNNELFNRGADTVDDEYSGDETEADNVWDDENIDNSDASGNDVEEQGYEVNIKPRTIIVD